MRPVPTWVLIASFLLVLGGLGQRAQAGICLDDSELDGYVADLEAAAATPAKAAGLSEYWRLCLEGDAARRPRIVAACTTIVARLDLRTARGPAADCAMVLVGFGVNPLATRTGPVDLVAELLAKPLPPHQDPRSILRTLAASGDPRVLPWVIDLYRAHAAAVTARPLRGWRANGWRLWNLGALAVIERQGGAAELAVLDELAAATRDRGLRRLITRARGRLAKRLAAAPP